MRALSIREPYAEGILRKIKKIEFRDHRNGVRIGERFTSTRRARYRQRGTCAGTQSCDGRVKT